MRPQARYVAMKSDCWRCFGGIGVSKAASQWWDTVPLWSGYDIARRSQKRPPPHVLVLAVLGLAVFAGAASMRILDALLPSVARQFGQSIGTTSMTITAYALSYGCCQFFYGPLGNRIGPYRIVCWAAALSAGVALCCAFAPSLPWLILMRLIAGGIAAAIGPLALTWISHATPTHDRPVVVARMSSASILGATVGQVSSGLIGQAVGWRASFSRPR
jgi:MFS transporter, YNFM family, putative membrane transport protein